MSYSNSSTKPCGNVEHIWLAYVDALPRSVYMINAILNGIFTVPTVVSNVVLLVAVWRTTSLRTPSNVLICALASTDCCVGLTQPIFVALLVSMLTNVPLSIKCTLLLVNRSLDNLVAVFSLFIFTAVSIDKLLMINLHLRYQTLITVKRVLLALAATFTVSVAITTMNFVNRHIYTFLVLVFGCLCFIISVVSYVTIYRTVLRHQQQIHIQTCAVATDHDKNDKLLDLARFKKRTLSMMVIYLVFLLSYFPYFCLVVIMTALEQRDIDCATAKIYAITLVFFNALLMPIMICCTMPEIRRAMNRTRDDSVTAAQR